MTRAWPELGRFTPAERRRLVRFAQRRHWCTLVLTSGFISAGVFFWIMLVLQVWTSVAGMGAPHARWFAASPAHAIGAWAVLALLLPVGPIAALRARDAWLRWALRPHVQPHLCFNCGYPADERPASVHVCPECGERAVRSAGGLVPARFADERVRSLEV